MAILGNLQAFIAVNGNRGKEYTDEQLEVENEKPDLVTKYLECKTGAAFTVQVVFDKTIAFKTNTIEIQVFLDGRWMVGSLVDARLAHSVGGYCLKLNGATRLNDKDWELRPFVFKEIKHGKINVIQEIQGIDLLLS